jgi:eukaryotic-like serine/threonine-protein kinase
MSAHMAMHPDGPILPGTRLGPYEILDLLDSGGMGDVYRARDPRLGRLVAIKALPQSAAADADRLQRFEGEARAAGALDHPNVLVVYDVGRHGDVPYLVTELLEGETLRRRLNETGAIPQRKTLDWAAQIARGLAAAHEKGIVHRDLKPKNLFVTRDGRLKILDFGLATLIHPAGDDEPTISVDRRTGTGGSGSLANAAIPPPPAVPQRHSRHCDRRYHARGRAGCRQHQPS